VEKLERDGKGLNLTYEVLEGIAYHSKGMGPIQLGDSCITLEARVLRISDIIAYINHDIDDALRAGIIEKKICLMKQLQSLERHMVKELTD